ncbi:MAG TPA: hypothetical protein VFC21_02560 [Bryobacteraceae bacterium]|nr:hypothetical protein [Bryobacteraceae bacterium]
MREIVGLIVTLLGIAGIGLLLWKFLRLRPDPDEIERLRRLGVNARGKLSEGEIIDLEGACIVYSYSVGGVGYTAAQDILVLESLLPADRMSIVGPVIVKFEPGNPANSIVLCEEWSGLARAR